MRDSESQAVWHIFVVVVTGFVVLVLTSWLLGGCEHTPNPRPQGHCVQRCYKCGCATDAGASAEASPGSAAFEQADHDEETRRARQRHLEGTGAHAWEIGR